MCGEAALGSVDEEDAWDGDGWMVTDEELGEGEMEGVVER